MNLKISRLYLLKGLNAVQRAVSGKSPIPALSGIKFDLDKEGLNLLASDGDITIQTRLNTVDEEGNVVINVIEEGSVLLSSKYITEIIRKIERERIGIELIDSSLVRVYDSISNFNLNAFKVEDYPNIDFSTEGIKITLSSDDFKNAIFQTSFAASDKEARPLLTGVNIKSENNQVIFNSTDSYRLAIKKIPMKLNQNFNVIIPAKNLVEVGRLIDNERSVDIIVCERKIIFKLDNTIIISKIINGQFPDTSKLIPTSFESKFETSSSALISAVERASVLFADKMNFIKLAVTKEKAIISSKNQEIGSVTEHIENFRYEGPALEISFTSKFMIEAVRAIGTEDITILFNGDMRPFIIRHNNDENHTQLILPVRTY